MNSTRSGSGPDHADAGSWATESLPMSVRKQLLERELNKLGLRKAAAQDGSTAQDGPSAQQPGEPGSSNSQADANPSSACAD